MYSHFTMVNDPAFGGLLAPMVGHELPWTKRIQCQPEQAYEGRYKQLASTSSAAGKEFMRNKPAIGNGENPIKTNPQTFVPPVYATTSVFWSTGWWYAMLLLETMAVAVDMLYPQANNLLACPNSIKCLCKDGG